MAGAALAADALHASRDENEQLVPLPVVGSCLLVPANTSPNLISFLCEVEALAEMAASKKALEVAQCFTAVFLQRYT